MQYFEALTAQSLVALAETAAVSNAQQNNLGAVRAQPRGAIQGAVARRVPRGAEPALPSVRKTTRPYIAKA